MKITVNTFLCLPGLAHLIGAPLTAAMDAQAQAARQTVDFIREVGFSSTGAEELAFGELQNVNFSYKKANQEGAEATFELTVPLLTIVPIPYVRIETVDVNFRATLTDFVETSTAVSAEFNISASASVGWRWGKFKARSSYSRKSTSESKNTSTRSYEYDVQVHAVQDEIPGGLGKILGILENAISEKASS